MALRTIPSLVAGRVPVRMRRTVVPGSDRRLDALEACPDGLEPSTGVLFVHENRGLVPYMREVVEALASLGHLVVAPDLLSRLGGTDAVPEATTTRAVDSELHVADLGEAADSLAARVERWAVVGLCFGAEMGWRLVCGRRPSAAVLLYGVGPDEAAASRIGCPVYAVYAEDDDRVNATIDPTLAGLRASGAEFVAESHPGTRHAFHDHHRPDRFHPEAAAAVWRRLLGFIDLHLGSRQL